MKGRKNSMPATRISTLAENEKLEARAKASKSGKIKDHMERAKLESELHNIQRLVERIQPVVLEELKRQQRFHNEKT